MAFPERVNEITIEEFERFVTLPENEDRRFELIDGEIVEKIPTELHGIITGTLYALLWNFIIPRSLGRLVLEVRYRPAGDKRNDRLPDIAFTTTERLQPVVERGAAATMPDLVIEVKSPDDSLNKMRAKATYFLANGVRLVWLVLPEKKLIEVYRRDADADILDIGDTLDGGDVLPGFAIAVKDVFSSPMA